MNFDVVNDLECSAIYNLASILVIQNNIFIILGKIYGTSFAFSNL